MREASAARVEWRVLCWSAGFVSLGGFAWGLELGAVSGALMGARQAFDLSASETGLFVALMGPGELVGSLGGGFLGDRVGRRAAVAAAAAALVFTSFLTATAASTAVLLAARFAGGVAAGMSYVAQVAWASELAPPGRIGSLVTVYELAISAGYVATFAVFAGSALSWRVLFALPAAPALLQLLAAACGAPESPAWLRAARGEAAAEASMRRTYRRFGGDAAAAPVASLRAIDAEPGALGTWARPSLFFVGLTFLTFFTGGFNLRVFAVEVYRTAGLSERAAARATLALGVVKLGATAWMVRAIDGMDRKPLLVLSLFATALCALASAAALFAGYSALVVAAALAYTVAFQGGFGTLNFVLLGELFPPALKGRLAAFQQFPAALFKFASQFAFALAVDAGALTPLFIAHALVALVGAALASRYFVETRGRSPEAIRSAFRGRGRATSDDPPPPPPLRAPAIELMTRAPSDDEREVGTLLAENPLRAPDKPD